ncbi:type VI secretion system-associated protein TagF [Novilysobacter arseniciresistens]|uniref:type VI secretion system-associated protein TagF n=1 Tax=Novilysobacter arseniciresistens TaxID=1385522 RepID=UPI00068EF057|nr:type VI secretion system-associated protein TagF [Lysobacter arseniciresistens]
MVAVDTGRPLGCFGKLPSRGDFVRTPDQHGLMATLDRWAGGGIELLARSPDWKRLYDSARPLHFAFLGSRSRVAIGGHFVPSHDASERRFPFLAATRIELTEPLAFIGRSPLALSRLWSGLARHGREAVAAEDAGEVLRALAEARIQASADPHDYDAPFDDFIDLQDIGMLQGLLRQSGHPQLQLRWVLPALGLLMQPLIAGGSGRIDKALSLPLPADALYRPLVAALWLDLLAGFLGRADFELVLFIRDGDDTGGPQLVVGFNGADPRTLHAVLDPQVADEHVIRVDDAEWVEDQVDGDYALNRLVSFVARDDLSLRQARRTFNETFLGT